jgi:hypothetical protein
MIFRLIGPQGDVLLDKPDFFSDKGTYEYHPPGFFFPITGHLSIPSGMDKGEYTLEYNLLDNLANSKITRRGIVEIQ